MQWYLFRLFSSSAGWIVGHSAMPCNSVYVEQMKHCVNKANTNIWRNIFKLMYLSFVLGSKVCWVLLRRQMYMHAHTYRQTSKVAQTIRRRGERRRRGFIHDSIHFTFTIQFILKIAILWIWCIVCYDYFNVCSCLHNHYCHYQDGLRA